MPEILRWDYNSFGLDVEMLRLVGLTISLLLVSLGRKLIYLTPVYSSFASLPKVFDITFRVVKAETLISWYKFEEGL